MITRGMQRTARESDTPLTAQEGYNVQTSSDCTPRNAAADEKRQTQMQHTCHASGPRFVFCKFSLEL